MKTMGELLQRDGWRRTDDMGYFDERHNVYLVDRKKDTITSGGKNIYSLEVKDAGIWL